MHPTLLGLSYHQQVNTNLSTLIADMNSMENTLTFDFKRSKEVYDNFRKFYSKKSISPPYSFDKSLSNDENLSNLSIHLLDSRSCACNLFAYKPLLIELVARLIFNPQLERQFLKLNNSNNVIEGCQVLSALSSILTYTLEISTLTEHFLNSKDFFSSLRNCFKTIPQLELQTFLLSFYRLLVADKQRFQKFIDPQTLHSLVTEETTSNINRYISIQLLSKYLFFSEDVKYKTIEEHVNQNDLVGTLDGDENINFKFLSVFEAQRLSNFSKLSPMEDCFSESPFTVIFKESELSPGVSIISGIIVPNLLSLGSCIPPSTALQPSFVELSKSLHAIRSFSTLTKTSQPILLAGSAGSGKTFLVDEMARRLHIEDMNNLVKIHLNQQTDLKTLLGTYTSGTKPGTFEWKNGVLTTAVKEGKWVLVEDIDKAPNEVLSILMSLLEHREITLPSRGEVLKAGNGFQLISTIRTTSNSNDDEIHFPDIIGLRLWNILQLPDLDEKDLKTILKKKFPLLRHYTDLFIKCYFEVKNISSSRKLVSMNKGAQPRQISIRDLMKFCRRSEHIFALQDIKSADDLIHDDVFDTIFQEAIACFTSAIVERDPIECLIKEIGSILEIPTSRINLQLSRHVPVIDNFDDALKVGRAYMKKHTMIGLNRYQHKVAIGNITSFATTNHSARLMEEVGVAISMCEPLLLVGETGTGKTTVVQQMAKLLNKKLIVINLSQQTEVGDLLGGFKPINAKTIALPLEEDFEQLFARSFSARNNEKFLKLLSKCFNKSQWKNVCRLWKEAYKMAKTTFVKSQVEGEIKTNKEEEEGKKKKRKLNDYEKTELMKEWKVIQSRVNNFEKQIVDMQNSFIFKFVEGSLVNAVKKGDWLLLDEMNLAAPETLDSISDLLAEYQGQRSVLLSEKGDVESIKAHPDFRIFGCMNPATDVGKKDLPQSIRSRFTEVYVASPDQDIQDLLMIIDKYIGKYALSDEWIGNDVAELYLEAKKLSDDNAIVDGANQKPHFSIRTLTRTLLYAREIASIYGLRRALYEGFCMSLLTLLDAKSEQLLVPVIRKYTIERLKNAKSVLSQIPSDPSTNNTQFIQFGHYWMRKGSEIIEPQTHYIITPFVEKNMMNLVRATSGGKFPILIQGPTSAGKTSMINYLAKISGHKFVRINNHEHTDLHEYLGTYVSDDSGKLVFKEGILVDALRHGHWIVLDELNLAPTDVLEALNRLLDDNRELFIPETQEIVRPHPDFMLFATQNPPGLYGGRKVLSKAFRNRFLELHFDDIPQDELEIILRERCKIAPSYAKKIVDVYKELGIKRQSARLFEQKNSFATLRDLFRWAQREAVGYEQLAANGYMLLAERVRRPEEKIVVKEALEKVMRVRLDMRQYYSDLEIPELLEFEGPVIWTKAMRRLAVLVMTSMQNNEPLLLVGETGCGKTTVCQMIAKFFKKELVIVNAHQNTETGDLLGAQRPIRNRSDLQLKFVQILRDIASRHNEIIDSKMSFNEAILFWKQLEFSNKFSAEESDIINKAKRDCESLFEWNDGPLVSAMKGGEYFLLDEISLADDSVLERLNSILEPERSLLLTEKGSGDIFVTAHPGFQFLATMNPGGDYGKKELSPALRNRFTEIWVPSMEDFEDVRQIVSAKLSPNVKHLTNPIVEFSKWYGNKMGAGDPSSGVLSLRDILAWITFINTAQEKQIPDMAALLHGACMVFIDALGTHNTAYLAENEENLRKTKLEYVKKLSQLANHDLIPLFISNVEVSVSDSSLTCGVFSIERRSGAPQADSFNLEAPTTASNAARVVRALQVQKPILLEGSPGVGKTSLITALALATGNELTRINLSEQTDLIDLFGSDSPVEGGQAGEFVWRDAPYLRAMQKGEWVLLDEMNLASQSVLEGLNACLDHRGEVYIPELDKSFISHPDFKVFAAQNPQLQGGGRKGLPKSFINRFSVVYVDMLTGADLKLIAHHLYPSLNSEMCGKLISFMSKLEEEVVIKRQWGSSGAPWEFNLRDTLRWLSLIETKGITNSVCPSDFFDLVVRQRFRTEKDKEHASNLFMSIFGRIELKDPYYMIDKSYVQCQNAFIQRNALLQYQCDANISHLQCNVPILETIFRCIQQAYPLILVGSSGSGKSSLIKFAADVVGSKVYEFSMNSDIDSMDILGGYEQADYSRTLARCKNEISECLLRIIAINTYMSASKNVNTVQIATKLLKMLNVQTLTLTNVKSVLEQLLSLTEFYQSENLLNLIQDLREIDNSVSSDNLNANFEWFDGLLVEAVEKGYWLILDNANLCSPSVLDRLNSLLETNGMLIINECTNDDGTPRVIRTHPNFRLFLTSDPKYGELSRAMRNRSVEIYVEPLEERATAIDRQVLGVFPDNQENVALTEKVNSLTISVPSMTVTSFLAVNDSHSMNISSFIDYYNAAQFTGNTFVSSTFLQLINISSVRLILELTTAASNSTEFSDLSLLEKFKLKTQFLENYGLIDAALNLYKRSCASSPLLSNSAFSDCTKYPVSVLTNESLYPLIKDETPYAISSETSFLFIVLSMLSDAFIFMKNLHDKAEVVNASVLNPLEQLAAISLGRDLKKIPPVNVYKWLVEVLTFVNDQFSEFVKSQNLLKFAECFEPLFKLIVLWNNFVVASSSMNQTAIRVYHDNLVEWFEKHRSKFNSTMSLKLENFITDFNNRLKMFTGSSMTLIWNACRGTYPQTASAWQNYELLLKVANDFDRVAYEQFPENIENVNEFRRMLISLFDACMEKTQQDDFVEIIESMKLRINELSNISDSFLSKRAHSFEAYFVSLLGFIESKKTFDKSGIELNSETLSLCLLANKRTADLIDHGNTELFKPFPKIFRSLWSSDGSLQLPLFDDKFLKSTMTLVSEIEMTKGGNIDQTLFDMKLFISSLLNHSQEVLADHTNYFASILQQWIAFINDVHVDLLESDEVREFAKSDFRNGSADSLRNYCSTFRNHGYNAYADIFETYFIPSLLTIGKPSRKRTLGESFLLTACGFIMLYMPDSAYDPAAVDHILYKDFLELQKLIANIKESFNMARTEFFGDNTITAEKYLPELESNSITEVPRVFRDSRPAEKLFEEWHQFFSSYVGKEHIKFLLKTATEITEKAGSQIDNFMKNATYFVLRLKENHMRFSDLNDILAGFVDGLKLGLFLTHEGTRETSISSPSSLWISDASVTYSPSRLSFTFESTQEAVRKVSVNDFDAERIYAYLLLLFKTPSYTNISGDPETFNEILMALYYRWSLRMLKEQEKESNESGVYKFADSAMDAEADFRKLFPDSDQVMDVSASESIVSNEDPSDVYYAIAKAYVTKFNSDSLVSSEDISNASIDAFKSLRRVQEISGSGNNSASVLITIFSLLNKSYGQFGTTKKSSEIDFYHGYDFSQTRVAVSVIRKVQISVAELLKKWPEHATLSELFRICTEFMEFSSSTPIFRLLAKVEQIFTFIAEWEKYAHSGVSLASLYQSVSELIVSWRQLELASWKQVFVNEEMAIEKRIGKWWFHLFETIIVPAINDEIYDEELEIKILSAINIFLSQATYGELSYRLDLLMSFAQHLEELAPRLTLRYSLLNIITFYEQFLSQISESVSATKKDLEKKVNEIILLASWKDVNIDALKQSSRRSHNSLYKIIRKYRDHLMKPVKPLIEEGLPPSNKVYFTKPVSVKTVIKLPADISRVNQLCSEVSTWSERNTRLKNSAQVEKNMKIYLSDIESVEFRSLHDYAKSINERAEYLRKETPRVYTKENKKVIGSLKNEKHKLLSDTIKDLKTMGLRLSMTADIQSAIPSVTAVLATSQSLRGTSFCDCDAFYFRILDLLPKLRVSVAEVHADINPSDSQKCLAASENLLFILVRNRNVLVKFSNFNSSLKQVLSSLETISIDSSNKLLPCSEFKSAGNLKKDAISLKQQLPFILRYAIDSLQKASSFTQEIYDVSIFSDALNSIEKYNISQHLLIGSNDYVHMKDLHLFFEKFMLDLNSWKLKNIKVSFVADFVLEWISAQEFTFNSSYEIESTTLNIEALEQALRELFNSILVSVQRIHKFNFKAGSGNEVDDNDNWLTLANEKLLRFVDLLYPVSVMKKFTNSIQILRSIEYNEHESLLAAAMVEHMLPVIQHYFNLVQIIEEKLKTSYIDISRGAFELSTILNNICSKGFCQPEPPSDEKEDNNLKEGTGLGDGEGAQNNSNDVEEDEDLSEHAQQPNEEKNKDDQEQEENDDAVDIEGDMAGDLENASDQENEDKNEEEKEDNEDLDEEIDDLDDLDPNAIDDKMWDEEATSNSKEKESEQLPDDSKQDNDMEAMEDEPEDKENEKEDDKATDPPVNDEEKKEDDQEADEEEDVGEQEDKVRNEENDQFDNTSPEADALELPEDMNLDSDGEENSEDDENAEGNLDDDLDENDADMKSDEENDAQNGDDDAEVEMDHDEPEGDEENEDIEGKPAEDEGTEEEQEEDSAEGDTNDMELDNEEINEDEGIEASDQELQEGEDDEKKEDKGGEENVKQDEIEGLENAETGANNADDESAVKQQSGLKSEGADADADEENENVGASNGGADFQNKEEEKDENSNENETESSRNEAAESMKQLGDSLKEFHRRRQEIKESVDDDMIDQKAGERPDEFQHLEGENTETETQALGAANKDQIQAINDDMAIDDDEEDIPRDEQLLDEDEQMNQNTEQKDSESADVEMKDANTKEDDFAGEKHSGFMNERNNIMKEIATSNIMEADSSDSELDGDEDENDIGNNAINDLKKEERLRPYEEAEGLWKKADEATRDLTSSLCEQLRLILEPTLSTKLKGDYKTGKRLNMKRIIPYIASQFRKDKIWMRRTKPSKRQYQIMISLDDSKSMAESQGVDIAFQSVALVSKALSQLESGQLSIMKFGSQSEVVHPFEKQFGGTSGINVFREFKFDDTRTDIKKLVSKSLKVFSDARAFDNSDLWQLEIVLSDGVCEDHETIKRLVRRAREEKVMIVFVVIDGLNGKESILDMDQASYITDDGGKMKLQVNKYLDTFPFEFYVVVHHINELPEMLSLILRQYFSELASS